MSQPPQKKAFPLRLDPALYAAIERAAASDLRSVNAQVECLLREALQRAARRLEATPREPSGYLHGRLRGEQVRIALDEVISLQADEKYVTVQHTGGELLIEESLRQLEDTYPQQLVRLHRNCLVPHARLVGLKTLADGRTLARLAGTELQPEVSRRNLPALRKLLRMG